MCDQCKGGFWAQTIKEICLREILVLSFSVFFFFLELNTPVRLFHYLYKDKDATAVNT